MVFSRYAFLFLMFILMGCAQVSKEQRNIYTQGYRAGVKEQVKGISGEFNGDQFPYYHWISPIVQDVHVPGHIANGVFIPEHTELVIIKPGEWAKSPAYPINNQRENYEQANVRGDVSFTNITHLPSGHGSSRDAQ